MRPRGEVRAALAGAFERLVRERGLVAEGTAVDGVPWRDAAMAAQVGFEAARETVKNMTRAGELVRVGAKKAAGTNRWEGLYAPAVLAAEIGDTPQPWGGIEALAQVMRDWPGPGPA